MLPDIAQVIINFRREIGKTFAMLDADGGGEIDSEEFIEGLQALVNGNDVTTVSLLRPSVAHPKKLLQSGNPKKPLRY